ncbi:hypothetical protein C8Q76DRAFT_71267 [Earliella scabrosa]|nr:hypothetical protein C8Q76DRAFT_71267 [Earliella scabrosa]
MQYFIVPVTSLFFLAGQVAAITPTFSGHSLLPRQADINSNEIPRVCQTRCTALGDLDKCNNDFDCSCTEAFHQGIGDCLQCFLTLPGADESTLKDAQSRVDAFDSVCKAGGKEFAPIKLELKPAKESESGDTPNTQSGGNNSTNTQQEDDGGNGAVSSALSMGALAGAFGFAMAAFAL